MAITLRLRAYAHRLGRRRARINGVLGADGNYTFTLLQQLDQSTLNGATGDDTENELTIALGSVVQATDADGDPVIANANGLVITVDDDTPQAQDDTATLVIRIDNLGVGPVLAEWTNTVLSSGSPVTFDRDGDGLTDEIRWGTTNNRRSVMGLSTIRTAAGGDGPDQPGILAREAFTT